MDQGESRDAGFRVLIEPPLGVNFEVDEENRIVRVVAVWHYVE